MDAERVEVVLANADRVTVRVGDVFLKIDGDPNRTDREVEAMALAPVPTPEVLWRQPPVLALAALEGRALGDADEPSAWAAVGAALRTLHDAPLPPWPGRDADELAERVEQECAWLVANGVLPVEVVTHHRHIAEAALGPWTPVFTHGDLHAAHVLVVGDDVTGVLDWSEAGPGDAAFDLAVLTLAHEERLGDVLEGYGAGVDLDRVLAWRSWRCLVAIRWLIENGYGPPDTYPEVALLRRTTRAPERAGSKKRTQRPPGDDDAMTYTVDFETVSTKGLESSPVADALAGLRANEARYFKNKYDHVFTTEPASKAKKTVDWVHGILAKERDLHISSTPLEATAFEVDGIKMAYVFYESGLAINVMYTVADGGKRAVGFKLSDGMEVPEELADRFKFARQKSKLAGTIRGSFFVIKGEH